jgi:hypothetical protein
MSPIDDLCKAGNFRRWLNGFGYRLFLFLQAYQSTRRALVNTGISTESLNERA